MPQIKVISDPQQILSGRGVLDETKDLVRRLIPIAEDSRVTLMLWGYPSDLSLDTEEVTIYSRVYLEENFGSTDELGSYLENYGIRWPCRREGGITERDGAYIFLKKNVLVEFSEKF